MSQPPRYLGNNFLVVLKLLSADCIFQRTEKMVVGRSQMRAVRWMRQDSPLKFWDGLTGMQTCVWPRIAVVRKHFCLFMGTNLPETLLQSLDIDVRFEYDCQLVTLLQASQLLMSGPSAGDQTHCPVLVLAMPIAPVNIYDWFLFCQKKLNYWSLFRTHVAHRLHFESSLLRCYLTGNLVTMCINSGHLKAAACKIFVSNKIGPR
jgi:hypothetical protein